MPDLSAAFVEGTWPTRHDDIASLSLHALGNLVLPTGQIVACDPFVIVADPPYTRSVPPGRYPVLVNVARMTNHDERVAYAILRISDVPPARWEMALAPEQDPATLGEDDIFGYGVDSGTGCFVDAAALKLLAENDYSDEFDGPMREKYVHTWSWVDHVLDPGTGANVIAFSSGYGDGEYPSYWGLDENGAVVCLVTDFMVMPDPEE